MILMTSGSLYLNLHVSTVFQSVQDGQLLLGRERGGIVLTRLCSNGAQSPEVTNTWLRASEKNYPVARPGTLAYCISSR